jgi:hypothetical protein
MSVCTGTVIRFTDYETPRWVDTLSGANSPTTYAALTSAFCGLIPFIDHIFILSKLVFYLPIYNKPYVVQHVSMTLLRL